MNSKLICAKSLLLALIVVLFSGCKNDYEEGFENGILPEEYSWAYGAWHIAEVDENPESKEQLVEYDVYIGTNYVQSEEQSLRILKSLYKDLSIRKSMIYPVYTCPKQTFIVDQEMSTDSILYLVYTGIGGYDSYICLKKETKSICYSVDNTRPHIVSNKFDLKVDEDILSEYKNKMKNHPINGKWKDEFGKLHIEQTIDLTDSNWVMAKNNLFINYDWFCLYQYVESYDKIVYFEDTDNREYCIASLIRKNR